MWGRKGKVLAEETGNAEKIKEKKKVLYLYNITLSILQTV